jgi:hypothetical protein
LAVVLAPLYTFPSREIFLEAKLARSVESIGIAARLDGRARMYVAPLRSKQASKQLELDYVSTLESIYRLSWPYKRAIKAACRDGDPKQNLGERVISILHNQKTSDAVTKW